MGHLVRWFTILKTGDCPVRKLLVYPRVKYDEANNHIRNIFLGRHHNTIFWNPKATVSFWASPTMGCCQISPTPVMISLWNMAILSSGWDPVGKIWEILRSLTPGIFPISWKFYAISILPTNGTYTILWIPLAQRSLHSPPDSNGKITNRTSHFWSPKGLSIYIGH